MGSIGVCISPTASSIARAIDKTLASPLGGPISCKPTGNPLLVNPTGIEMAGSPAVVDRNEFVGDIYIKPARSINFIRLNFVAVRSGVEFSEVAG